MSREGIKIAAKVFSSMQEAAGELMRLGSTRMAIQEGHQDLRLAHMLEDGKNAMKDKFARETLAIP